MPRTDRAHAASGAECCVLRRLYRVPGSSYETCTYEYSVERIFYCVSPTTLTCVYLYITRGGLSALFPCALVATTLLLPTRPKPTWSRRAAAGCCRWYSSILQSMLSYRVIRRETHHLHTICIVIGCMIHTCVCSCRPSMKNKHATLPYRCRVWQW